MLGLSQDRAVWLARHILPHEPALRAWLCRRRLISLELDDVVQEAYAVLASLDSVEHIHAPKAYFFSVAHSLILQHLRRERVVRINAMAEIEALRIFVDAPSPEEEVAGREELRHVASLIAGLPPRCRQAFTLRKIEGLSQKEIARRMGVSEHTVEKQIATALRLLMQLHSRVQGPALEDRGLKSDNRRGHAQTFRRR